MRARYLWDDPRIALIKLFNAAWKSIGFGFDLELTCAVFLSPDRTPPARFDFKTFDFWEAYGDDLRPEEIDEAQRAICEFFLRHCTGLTIVGPNLPEKSIDRLTPQTPEELAKLVRHYSGPTGGGVWAVAPNIENERSLHFALWGGSKGNSFLLMAADGGIAEGALEELEDDTAETRELVEIEFCSDQLVSLGTLATRTMGVPLIAKRARFWGPDGISQSFQTARCLAMWEFYGEQWEELIFDRSKHLAIEPLLATLSASHEPRLVLSHSPTYRGWTCGDETVHVETNQPAEDLIEMIEYATDGVGGGLTLLERAPDGQLVPTMMIWGGWSGDSFILIELQPDGPVTPLPPAITETLSRPPKGLEQYLDDVGVESISE